MGNSLLDQLKKSGLVDDKRVKQVKNEKYHQQKQQQGKKKTSEVAEATQLVQQSRAEQAERDRLFNQQRQEERVRKERVAQIKQLITTQRIEQHDGDVAYNFTEGGKVKRLYLSATLHKQVVAGQLAIVTFDGQYDLVPLATAQKIAERDVSYIIVLNQPTVANAQTPDDPYAAYPIPDDLLW
ncbi:MAG: hypothetical protein FD130_504 [Halothiobacillaceae bacterium]|nr:MAG: hypothetical protein FD130_504 [Halothiobacillaceae bacterium]